MIPTVYQTRQSHKPDPKGRDNCQSPPYAVLPILEFIKPNWTVWEPARGEGLLAKSIRLNGFDIVESGLSTEQDFFNYQPDRWDVIITNPPYSRAADFLKRCYELNKPFALLMKTEIQANRSIQVLCSTYGDLEFVYPESRIDYKMPRKGWASGAQFNTHWYTCGLCIGKPFTYLGRVSAAKRAFKKGLAQ